MGMLLKDSTALDLLAQHNKRFGAGADIDEMIELHREFKIFAPDRPLRKSFDLIGIRPHDQGERRRWYIALDHLKTYPSDIADTNGHDRLIKAYVDNFSDPKPLPIFMRVHSATDDERVLVTKEAPIVFIPEEHLVISIPTKATSHRGGKKPK